MTFQYLTVLSIYLFLSSRQPDLVNDSSIKTGCGSRYFVNLQIYFCSRNKLLKTFLVLLPCEFQKSDAAKVCWGFKLPTVFRLGYNFMFNLDQFIISDATKYLLKNIHQLIFIIITEPCTTTRLMIS